MATNNHSRNVFLYGKVYISIILFSLFERNRRDSGRDLLNPLRVCRNSEETSISIHRKLNFRFYCLTNSQSILHNAAAAEYTNSYTLSLIFNSERSISTWQNNRTSGKEIPFYQRYQNVGDIILNKNMRYFQPPLISFNKSYMAY